MCNELAFVFVQNFYIKRPEAFAEGEVWICSLLFGRKGECKCDRYPSKARAVLGKKAPIIGGGERKFAYRKWCLYFPRLTAFSSWSRTTVLALICSPFSSVPILVPFGSPQPSINVNRVREPASAYTNVSQHGWEVCRRHGYAVGRLDVIDSNIQVLPRNRLVYHDHPAICSR